MNHKKIIAHLRVNGDVFRYLLENVSDQQAPWKPYRDRWSMLEVVNFAYLAKVVNPVSLDYSGWE
jgi:hypothetical protein